MKKILFVIGVLWILTGCINDKKDNDYSLRQQEGTKRHQIDENEKEELHTIINEEGVTIKDRINVPKGFTRIKVEEQSFAAYLRQLPLKPHGSKVLYYNGKEKKNLGVYEAVVDMDIGEKNLQQCADAIMRLRGEYLFEQNQWDRIHFNLTNGFLVDYSKWIKGFRVVVDGNKTSWEKKTEESNDYSTFRHYMDFVFIYAGTLSLSQELQSIELNDMQIGDIFIQGGSPGHAVIVVDMAENQETGQKLYMLAQSYMPAQDIQILKNPNLSDISPWYVLDDEGKIPTPEWTFTDSDLKRFYDE